MTEIDVAPTPDDLATGERARWCVYISRLGHAPWTFDSAHDREAPARAVEDIRLGEGWFVRVEEPAT